MKNLFKKVNDLTSNLDLSSVQGYLDKVTVDVKEAGKASKDTFVSAAEKSVNFIHETIDSEQVTSVFDNVKNAVEAGVDGVKKQADLIINSRNDNQEKASAGTEPTDEIKEAIRKLDGKDKVGVVGESLTTAVGAVAGLGAAGSLASAAGATTLLGSSSLASALGGVFVTATPVGWVVGSAVVAGAAGYGIAKLVRSGSQQDRVREDLIKRLKQRLEAMNQDQGKDSALNELRELLPSVMEKGLISEIQAEKMIKLIEEGKLDASSALNRIKILDASKPHEKTAD